VEVAEGDAPVSVLFSVPKMVFKRAWMRNLLKRRMRESYRRRKHVLHEALGAAAEALGAETPAGTGRHLNIALICAPAVEKGAKTAQDAKAAKSKKSSAPPPEIPNYKTIDDAIARILEQILARL
jgi:hypothetical protein